MVTLILKIAVVVAGWLIGFKADKKRRQLYLAIPVLITIAFLFVDGSDIKKLGNTIKSLLASYKPIEKTALERYPDLPKEKAIRKYLEDLNKIGDENKQLREDHAKNLQKMESLEKEGSKNKRQLTEQQAKLDIIQEFTEVASWKHIGETESGGGVSFSGPLSGLLNKRVTEKNGGIVWQCNPEALKDYQRMIKQYPRYPFPYWYIGMCLKEARDPSWKSYATKGLELFMKTTTIPKHSLSHDSGLKSLKETLQESGRPLSGN